MRARRVRKHETTAASGRPAKHSQVSHLLPSRSGPARAHASHLLRRLLHLHAASGSRLRYPLHHGPRRRARGTSNRTRCRQSCPADRTCPVRPGLDTVSLRVGSQIRQLHGATSRDRRTSNLRDRLPPSPGSHFRRAHRIRLELVPPGTLSYHRRQPIQYVPAAFGGPRDKTGLTYVDLDPATLVTFRLEPAEEAAVRKMVNFLRAASSLHRAETPLMERSIRDGTPYSFTEHQRERGELFAKVTEPIGWNVRELFQDNHLAPYDVWRKLRFLEFKIRLRDLIMNRLNTTLSEVGSQLDFQAAIELKRPANPS